MAPLEEMHQAQVNRSIRTIKAELEYLCDASVISPQTLSDLLSRIPPQTALHAPLSVGAIPPATQNIPNGLQSPMSNLSLNNIRTNSSFNEKQETSSYYQPQSQPPPTYASPPPQASWQPPSLCKATALYAYTSADAGDLELQPNDQITVTEYMNAEWWKGRSSRTGQEGIFPRSYVKVLDEKGGPPVQDTNTSTYSNNYGNMPLEGKTLPSFRFLAISGIFLKEFGNMLTVYSITTRRWLRQSAVKGRR